jgi:putative hydroxymethylpyrimidine transport system substrate-binding protein
MLKGIINKILFLVGLLILAACTPTKASPSSIISMTFMAGYKPQANLPFVGIYVAK